MLGNSPAESAIAAAKKLRTAVARLDFSTHVPWVYNPLDYAWCAHEQYLRKYLRSSCRVLFVGMNPGPWGMTQTGIPFGEILAVRDWLKIDAQILKPKREHPKRPIEGLCCARSEVSGRRLWGLFAERFQSAEAFFDEHFVANYCPLVFMEDSARNLTPDRLPLKLRSELEAICDQHLAELVQSATPEWVIGVGGFAEKCALRIRDQGKIPAVQVARILHPSPASPAANKDWSGTAKQQLISLGVW